MKIGNPLENLSQIQNTQVSIPSAQSAGSPSAAAASSDTAHLSSLSSQVTQATTASNTSDLRLDKVAAVQNALAAGTYSVPASQVASKLVDALLVNKA